MVWRNRGCDTSLLDPHVPLLAFRLLYTTFTEFLLIKCHSISFLPSMGQECSRAVGAYIHGSFSGLVWLEPWPHVTRFSRADFRTCLQMTVSENQGTGIGGPLRVPTPRLWKFTAFHRIHGERTRDFLETRLEVETSCLLFPDGTDIIIRVKDIRLLR
jgi:hypothetical protein